MQQRSSRSKRVFGGGPTVPDWTLSLSGAKWARPPRSRGRSATSGGPRRCGGPRRPRPCRPSPGSRPQPAATRGQAPARRDGTREKEERAPGGAVHVRPARPRPAVCSSATARQTSGVPASSHARTASFVDPTRSNRSCRARNAVTGPGPPLAPHRPARAACPPRRPGRRSPARRPRGAPGRQPRGRARRSCR